MSSISMISLSYRGSEKTVALFPGLDADELNKLLQAVFFLPSGSSVVGFLAENGLVVPISLACKTPGLVPDSGCVLLLSGPDGTAQSLPSVPVQNAATMPPAPPSAQDEAAKTNDVAAEAMNDLLTSIARLRSQRVISSEQARILEELVFDESLLIYAVYSVAISANDSEYFAEVCRDLAQTLQSEEGRMACSAQEEVLQVCDELYKAGTITKNQLLYLRHLVLIRNESVATIYDEFQNDDNVQRMAASLYKLVNTPYKGEADKAAQASAQQADNTLATALSTIVAMMMRKGAVTAAEASILMEMVRLNNEYVVAAYELYEQDGDLAELQDTLTRCARLEVRRRQAATMAEAQTQEDEEEEDDDSEEDSEEDSEDDSEEEEGEEDDDEEENVDDSVYNSTVENVLSILNVKNVWGATVPNRFILICFEAVHHRLFSVGQARALCDLYQAKYDMVLAAWEVYKVQNDMRDFTDTLRRVVRDFSFDEDGAVVEEEEEEAEEEKSSAVSQARASEARRESEAEGQKAAMHAVVNAKLDLLKHSLEMMVNQELTTEANAVRLFERAKAGDVLVDAAIESYAGDRDVADFLDTLQILANHSAEELDTFLRAASADLQQQQQQASAPQSAANASSDLRAIVTDMVRIGILQGNEETALLLDLIDRKDGRVMAAYESYSSSKDKEDLFDTLFRIVSIEINAKKPSGARTSPQKAASPPKQAPAPAETAKPARLLTATDQKTVVDILSKASALSAEQVSLLLSKIDGEDPYLQKIFSKYEEDKDVYSLIDLLKSIQTYDEYNQEEEDEEDEDDDEEEDDDDEDEEGSGEGDRFTPEERQTIESRFLQIVQDMDLTQMETAALRLAIARNDASIRNALEAFRGSLDDRSLVSSLKTVARRVIVEMLQETEANTEAEDKGDDDEEEEEDDDEDDDDEDDEEDDDEDDDDEDDEEDDEEEEEDEENTRMQMHESIFPLLVHELEKAKILSARDGEALTRGFAAKNAAILGALDLYDRDQNLNNLVVALKKVSLASQ